MKIDKNLITAWNGYNKTIEAFKHDFDFTSNIVGDFSERIVADLLNATIAKNSQKGHDLIVDKKKYQVKGRKLKSATKTTTQLSVCRSLDFDYLITVLYNPDGSINTALQHKIKYLKTIEEKSYNNHQEGWVFSTTNDFITNGEDITKELQKIFNKKK